MFHPIAQANLTLFAHIIYYNTTKVLVWNISDQSLHISCHQKLDYIVDIYYNNYFLADAKAAFNLTTILFLTILFFEHKSFYTPTTTDLSMEKIRDNEVKVYEDKYVATLLA